MKNNFFHDLYTTIWEVRVRDCSAKSLSHLLHGYLSVYAMVRISPGLEREYGTLQEIYGRLREIAEELSKAAKDTSIELDERIGYIADLMDAYQTYSDMDLLNEALDMAYQVLSVDKNEEIVIPGKTPNVCRLLCNLYYFTGDKRSMFLAKCIIKEWRDYMMKENFLYRWQKLLARKLFGSVMEDFSLFVVTEEEIEYQNKILSFICVKIDKELYFQKFAISAENECRKIRE